MGTYGYWAPEVDAHQYHDIRADLYSVGRLILKLACGDESLFYAGEDEIRNRLTGCGWSQGGIGILCSLLATMPHERPLGWEIEVTWSFQE